MYLNALFVKTIHFANFTFIFDLLDLELYKRRHSNCQLILCPLLPILKLFHACTDCKAEIKCRYGCIHIDIVIVQSGNKNMIKNVRLYENIGSTPWPFVMQFSAVVELCFSVQCSQEPLQWMYSELCLLSKTYGDKALVLSPENYVYLSLFSINTHRCLCSL